MKHRGLKTVESIWFTLQSSSERGASDHGCLKFHRIAVSSEPEVGQTGGQQQHSRFAVGMECFGVCRIRFQTPQTTGLPASALILSSSMNGAAP